MPIPGFQEFMLPMLRLLADGRERPLTEIRDRLASDFALSEAERNELTAGGTRTRLLDSVYWAKTHLAKADLISSPQRGIWRITPAGEALVAESPLRVDMTLLLNRFASYRAFRGNPTEPADNPPQSPPPVVELTALDALALSHRQLRAELADELLEQVLEMTPVFFEKLVVDLMLGLGYGGVGGSGWTAGRTGDGGIDGLVSEDKLGLDFIYLQAKRYKQESVGRPLVQAFVGSLEGHHARKGVFITTSTFTADARNYVKSIEKRVVLVDGAELAELMLGAGIGVLQQRTYVVQRVDSDYFQEA